MKENSAQFRVNPGIHLRETGGEGILYDTQHKKVHILNDTASYIWRACCENQRHDEISVGVSEVYDVPLETARTDVEETLRTFAELELIEFN